MRICTKPVLLNNVVLTFLLIAALGIIAAIAFGAFYALKPKFSNKKTVVTVYDSAAKTAEDNSGEASEDSTPNVELAKLQLPLENHEKYHQSTNAVDASDRLIHNVTTTAVISSTVSTVPITATTNGSLDTSLFKESEKNSSENDYITGTAYSTSELYSTVKPETPTVSSSPLSRYAVPNTAVEVTYGQSTEPKTHERVLENYGKVVGIELHDGFLYVPSYQTGKISVLSTPEMITLREHICPSCTVYDIAVLSTGDMIVAQGRQHMLTKINASGKVIQQLHISYQTKGITAGSLDRIFVLSRSHDKVYLYDSNLEHLETVAIPEKENGDCNFLAVNVSDVIHVSCQEAVYIFTLEGVLLAKLLPPDGTTYAVGIDIDEKGQTLVVRRGMGVVDVYDKNGLYVESVGESLDSLWSDIAVGEGYLYAVDYIEAKVKVFRIN